LDLVNQSSKNFAMLNTSIQEKFLLAFLLLLSAVGAFSPPISELAGYLHFADQRELFKLPRALDTLSNLPFAFFGFYGLWVLYRLPNQNLSPNFLMPYKPLAAIFFTGLIITMMGSAWFHSQPLEKGRLAIDRLGMLIAFSGLIGLSGAIKISLRIGYVLAVYVVGAGIASIHLSHTTGNALPWTLMQFGGLALVIVFATLKGNQLNGTQKLPPFKLGWVITFYAIAKVLEIADELVFNWTQQIISGHSLKHIVASLTAWPVVIFLLAKNRSVNRSGLAEDAGLFDSLR
jgi:hypothetical protein